MRHDSLAEKLLQNNTVEFWKEIKSMDTRSTPLPTNIDGKIGEREIVSLWREKYFEIFNCVPSDISSITYNNLDFCDEMIVTSKDVEDSIRKLDCGKACGEDAISAEHLKYASNRILPILSLCFTSCFVHVWLPADMISVILVPIIKDKAGKINCSSNYRLIALSSILSKVLEIIIFDKLQYYLDTCDNQFGFRKKTWN